MVKIRSIVGIFAFVWGVQVATAMPPVQAGEASSEAAVNLVRNLSVQVAATLAETRERSPEIRQTRLHDLIRKGFDLDLTSQFVLGKYWHKANEAQRAEFKDLFAKYLLNSYARHLGSFDVETLQIVDTTPVGDKDILVETNIIGSDGSSARPVWRVRTADGEPRIIDVSVDGVSLALTQRREFNSVISRVGLEGLLVILRDKLTSQAGAIRRSSGAGKDAAGHRSLLASILASPNANPLSLMIAAGRQ
ncbi:MAG: ABC transporter substrate-binding protein [Alphaproteobacteria bacterium]|nr:MAG: ABC transporter substrate-binding protein [Alphaproteobacteria bacterium]